MCAQKSAGIIITNCSYQLSSTLLDSLLLPWGLYLVTVTERRIIWGQNPQHPKFEPPSRGDRTACPVQSSIMDHRRITHWSLSPAKTSLRPQPCLQATHWMTWPVSSPVGLPVCFNSTADPPSFHQQSQPLLHPQTVTTSSVCSHKPSPFSSSSSSLDVCFVRLLTDVSCCWLEAFLRRLSTAWLDATKGSFCLVRCFTVVFIREFGAATFPHTS